jgi:hypothetical protein
VFLTCSAKCEVHRACAQLACVDIRNAENNHVDVELKAEEVMIRHSSGKLELVIIQSANERKEQQHSSRNRKNAKKIEARAREERERTKKFIPLQK